MSHYAMSHIVHLFCGIAFIGVVFFELLILEGMRRPLGPERMAEVELALIGRARKIMPWVVGALFVTGIAMAWAHRGALVGDGMPTFGALLWVKIAMAFSVLGHFVFALSRAATGCMNSSLFKRLHISVGAHMIGIVLLAKLMFYAG